MKRGQNKVTWTTLRGECFHCAHAPNKRQNEEKKNQLYFLPGWTKKKEMMICWTWGQWNQTQSSTLSLLFLTVRLDFASKGKREDIDYSKLNQQAVQKKRTFECAGRFSDFFIKKTRKQSLEKGCLPLILSYIIFILFIIWVVFQNINVFVNLYCLNFLKLWETVSIVLNYLKKTGWLSDFRGSWRVLGD